MKNKIFLLILSLLISLPLTAQKRSENDDKWDNWNFRVGPYFWFISLDGEIISPPMPPNAIQPNVPPNIDIDVSFKDISSSIKFAGVLTGVYRNKLLITQFHFTGITLESIAITPYEYLLQDNVIRLSYYAGDFELGYRILKKEKIELDILVGLKLAYGKVGLVTDLFGEKKISGERDYLILDPVIATNFFYSPWKRWEFIIYGDWGPSFITKESSYQYMVGVNFLISKSFYFTMGYRDHFIDLPDETATFNGRIKGPLIRLGVQF